ncbi:hypothetical protein [Geodermatophilus ruber]|uniref:Uncharacterized protein n=1 Tax=Geodermatophilus ruber TaxID=504800 RepID=A0A1I4BG92_9ACTN|nr:hypothetical protein [Geodermatophilus ruber]SFK67788.1 hypothetical protein SAMN04488085_10330 [Geodermatophilus ruber]
MRRSLSVRTVGLPLTLTTVLLAGCGASEDEQRQEAFCEEVPTLLEDITAELQTATGDPTQAPGLLDDAVSRLEAVEPPSEVADEWQALVDAWAGMRDLVSEADLTDPSANTDLAADAQQLQGDLVSTGEAVDEYGQNNC